MKIKIQHKNKETDEYSVPRTDQLSCPQLQTEPSSYTLCSGKKYIFKQLLDRFEKKQ